MSESEPSSGAVSDPGSILAALAAHDVRFLLIGGLAVQAHGYVRSTFDVDIIPRPDRENLERLADALRAIDARVVTDEGDDRPLDLAAEDLAIGDLFLSTKFGPLDLVDGPRPDLKRYERLNEAAIEAALDGFTVSIVGKDDLIAMKLAAGREKDLADVNALTESERGG